MSELLFFVLGLMIGGLMGVVLMCMLQINKVNEMESKIKMLSKKNDGGKNG